MSDNFDYEADLLTLVDDEGVEHEFEIQDEIEIDEGHFIALTPLARKPEDVIGDPDTYYIFEIVEEDGEEQLMELEDDETLYRIDAIFQERFNSEFFEEEE